MRRVTFASTNQNKYREVRSILGPRGIDVEFAKMELVEIQSDSLEAIAKEKARGAFSQMSRPVIVEDDGLFIDALSGFPGQYSSYVFKTIGNAGILKLLSGMHDRSASFVSLIAFCDGKDVAVFEGKVAGKISEKEARGGWGYDPIFVPDGAKCTYAELENKNDYSHRRKALDSFAEWYLHL
ncbi:MAG: XTP/dITP diphosphatase [Nitrososphaera sp.]|uniref:XTP/dITP diphosphatase n=1 Tax=Nitrososphaera sp. TaxID=1971748 RepID=UPI00183AED21|nr:XTP/dITP diphosphatase [Nitrososphaera sp.]NWG37068.1 XTP/dITP diphosphatase [Nitrososphaera sp.]